MSAYAEKLQSCLVLLVQGRVKGDVLPARALRRLAAKALRASRGGRRVGEDEVDDLVQEFLVKVLSLRGQGGAKRLEAEWAAMSPASFTAYVRSMLKNLAVDGNPAWDVQRALREVVKAALADGLPVAAGLPVTVEKSGRFVRGLVASACAELVERDVAATVPALTSALMLAYAFGVNTSADEEVAQLPSGSKNALETLAAGATSAAVVETFLDEVGPEGRQVLTLRPLGFAEMARRLGLALSTAHARYVRVETVLKRVARRHGADRETVARAIEQLGVA